MSESGAVLSHIWVGVISLIGSGSSQGTQDICVYPDGGSAGLLPTRTAGNEGPALARAPPLPF